MSVLHEFAIAAVLDFMGNNFHNVLMQSASPCEHWSMFKLLRVVTLCLSLIVSTFYLHEHCVDNSVDDTYQPDDPASTPVQLKPCLLSSIRSEMGI